MGSAFENPALIGEHEWPKAAKVLGKLQKQWITATVYMTTVNGKLVIRGSSPTFLLCMLTKQALIDAKIIAPVKINPTIRYHQRKANSFMK